MNGRAPSTLAARHLTLTRGNRPLFSDLSFSVESGHALVLRGSNGSGKTSLLRVLAGLTSPDTGEVVWDGAAWRPFAAARRAETLFIGHANSLKEELSAAENLADMLAFDGLDIDAQTQTTALKKVGLYERRDVLARRLSQGQKRRIGLARLSLSRCRLWLLDEPTNALDGEGVALFGAIVQTHLSAGGMACIATHLSLMIDAPLRDLDLGAAS